MKVTRQKRDELRRLCELATPGPWRSTTKRDNTPPDRGFAVLGGGHPGSMEEGMVAYCQRLVSIDCPQDKHNARLVAKMRNVLMDLLDDLDAADDELMWQPDWAGSDCHPGDDDETDT